MVNINKLGKVFEVGFNIDCKLIVYIYFYIINSMNSFLKGLVYWFVRGWFEKCFFWISKEVDKEVDYI